MTSSNVVLVVPFELKEEAKIRKCIWDKEKKYWFVPFDDFSKDDIFFQDYMRVDLSVSFNEKDEIKKLGGKWDPYNKIWYTYKSNEPLQKFMRFTPCLISNDTEKETIKLKKKVKNISQI